MDDARDTLIRLSAARGESLSELSRMIRRNAAYLQQFVHRGTPRRLAEDDRRLLARHFGVDEAELGASPHDVVESVAIPYLDVRASAGGGLIADGEGLIRAEPFAPELLRELGVRPASASLIAAAGDSMAPGILDGDRLLVDRDDRRIDGGVFVLRREDALSVKRVSRSGRLVTIASDNPAYPRVTLPGVEIAVLGRVKLLLRRPV